MANLHDCLDTAVQGGELSKDRAAAAGTEFDQLAARYEQAMPRHQAELAAATDLKEATKRSRRSRRHSVVNQLQAMRRIQSQIAASPDPALALRNIVEHSEGSGFVGESIQSVSNAMIKSVNAGLNDVLKAVSRNLIGNSRNPAVLRNVIRELHGDATEDAAAGAMAQSVRKQQQRLRQMFNAYGGDIGDLADYGVTHSHDVATIRKAGFDSWKDQVIERLDWSRIPNHKTGHPFSPDGTPPQREAVDVFLRDVYRGITTRGWDEHVPTMTGGGKALYNRRADPRILHFKSGSDWLEYNTAFGTSDPFSAMIGGLHGMARDVAQMRVLGPNPNMGLEYAIQSARKQAVDQGNEALETRVRKSGALAKTMLAHIDGSVNNTESEAWARFFGNTRKVLTSIQLGSAALSAVTDAVTLSVASRAVGMNPGNVLSRSAKLMASSASRESAARMGYVADTLADAGSSAARFTGDVVAGEMAERVSGFTMRASGLSFWTDMNKTAFQMEFAGYLADNAGRSIGDIDAPLLKLFDERGISAADWDLLRAPDGIFTEASGATFLSPFHWLEHQTQMPRMEAEGLALRVQMIIEEQLEFAVPTANIEGRARLVGDTTPGTFAGELLRSSTMYKSFAMSLTLGQYRRFMNQPTPITKATYAAKVSAGLFLVGALAVQLKEIAKGNDPRPMDDGKFAMAAAFQGGGLGIFGDFFASETSRAGGGIAETLAGPVAGFAGDVVGIGASNLQRAVEDKSTFLGRDVSNFVRYNTPVASSLWPTRVAFDRMVADQLQSFLDPEAEATWRRQMRQRERNYGTRTWWQRGELSPDRAPDLSNAISQGGN